MNLANKMRPSHIDQVLGQGHLLGKGKVLRRMIENKALPSLILYGPPGVGKTSIANALAGTLHLPFKRYNASINGKKELQDYAKESKKGPLVILIDEIHRLTRPNQDFLLPYMEEGSFIIIGATTDNPYFTVAPAIRSRAHIFELQPLTTSDIKKGLVRAKDQEGVSITEEALEHIAQSCFGDLRTAYNNLEMLSKAYPNQPIPLTAVEELVQSKAGDDRYDLMSALQKSIRGSDVDAALHYLARLIEMGDLEAICRRLTVIAYEDIGLARPEIGQMVSQAVRGVRALGLPEGRIPLGFIVIEMALSPKSNAAYLSIQRALDDLKEGVYPVPNHLRDTHYQGAKERGFGGYLYPHDYDGSWVAQDYLPEALKGTRYFKLYDDASQHEKALQQVADYYFKKRLEEFGKK